MRRVALLIGFFVGTGSVFLERRPVHVVPVVLAVQDLPVGLAITNGQLTVRLVDDALVDEGRSYATAEEVVGRIPMERIYGNEMVRADRLARHALGAGIDALLTPCTVAVRVPSSIPTAAETYVDAMLGDRVIASGVKVLASSDSDAVLEVAPEEARVAVGADRLRPHVGPIVDRACARPAAPLARKASPSLGPLYVAPPPRDRFGGALVPAGR
jgi:hypothetical protein